MQKAQKTGAFRCNMKRDYPRRYWWVDFHWGEYTYNMEGGSTIFLSELLEILQNGHEKGSLDIENDKKEGNDENSAENGAGENVQNGDSEGLTNEGNGSADVYPTTAEKEKLAAIIADMSLVESVEFSNPELMSAEKKSSEQAEEDWLLTSHGAFDTEEILTIKFTDGSQLKIRVTDEIADGSVCRIGDTGYATIKAAVAAVQANGTATIEMIADYTITSGNQVTIDSGKKITIISEEGYTYTISRGWDGSTTETNSLFYINHASSKLTTQNIIFDGGRNVQNSSGFGGRCIYIKNGSISIEDGTLVQNFYTNADGGSVYGEKPVDIKVSSSGSVQFDNCKAVRGGAIAASKGQPVRIVNDNSVTFRNCSGKSRGGAVSSNGGTLTLTNCSFDTCTLSAGSGGAVYGNGAITNCSFISCQAKNGGAVYGSNTITGSTFTDCKATNGGAVNGSGTMTRYTFTGCSATIGAAVYGTDNITIDNCTITGNNATSEGTVQVSAADKKIFLKGATIIKDNTYNNNSNPGRNLYLNFDNDTTINASGLTDDAEVWVYVNNVRHQAGKNFGTYSSGSVNGLVNECVNDESGQPLRAATFSGDSHLYWPGYDVELKLTNSEDPSQPVSGAHFTIERYVRGGT